MPPFKVEHDDSSTSVAERILTVVRAIRPGNVLSYGAVARLAGLPRGARLAARTLSQNSDPSLPWHRVLRADGRIAFPADSPSWIEQGRRLRDEGVTLHNGRVRMPRTTQSLDEAIWG